MNSRDDPDLNPDAAPGSPLLPDEVPPGRTFGKRWIGWLLWLSALAACPIGLLAVDLAYPDVPSYPPPWPSNTPPQRLANGLSWGHAWVSLAAAAAVPILTRRWLLRLLAWSGVAVWLGATVLFTLVVIMSKTGMYF